MNHDPNNKLGKYEKQMAEIGRCIDKLCEKGLLKSTGSESFYSFFYSPEGRDVFFYVYLYQEYATVGEGDFIIGYSDPTWQDQLLAKVDELIGESK